MTKKEIDFTFNDGNVKKVIRKIKKRILNDMKIFCDGNDIDIIRENFEVKKPSYSRLGKGITHILEDIVTPMICNAYYDELREAVAKDLSKEKGASNGKWNN